MILAGGGNNHEVLGIVNAAMGAGGVVGGLIVSSGKVKGNSVKMIYVSATLSFLLGDVMMGLGRNVIFWSFTAVATSLPIAFINAGQMDLLYRYVPDELQGRIFAISTFNTDYVLTKKENYQRALDVLDRAGYKITEE